MCISVHTNGYDYCKQHSQSRYAEIRDIRQPGTVSKRQHYALSYMHRKIVECIQEERILKNFLWCYGEPSVDKVIQTHTECWPTHCTAFILSRPVQRKSQLKNKGNKRKEHHVSQTGCSWKRKSLLCTPA